MSQKPKQKKHAYHHGDLRRVLLHHASEMLDAQGAEKLSLRDLAKRAQVSAAAPYRHFESKDALLSELAEEGFTELEARMAAAASDRDAVRQLLALASAYLDLAARRPHFFRMMFSADLGPSRTDEGIYRACDRVFAALVGLFAAGQKAGRLKAGVPEEQALLFWSTLHGYVMLLIDKRFEDANLTVVEHDALLNKLLLGMFRGLTRRT